MQKKKKKKIKCANEADRMVKKIIFNFSVTAGYNDNIFSLYSLILNMKLNIPKCQSCLTLLQLCALLEV